MRGRKNETAAENLARRERKNGFFEAPAAMRFLLSPSDAAPTETLIGRGAVDQSPTTSPTGVAKNLTPNLTTAPVTPQQAQQPKPGIKRARTPEEAGTLLERSSEPPLLNTPTRGMNVTAVEFDPRPTPTPTAHPSNRRPPTGGRGARGQARPPRRNTHLLV